MSCVQTIFTETMWFSRIRATSCRESRTTSVSFGACVCWAVSRSPAAGTIFSAGLLSDWVLLHSVTDEYAARMLISVEVALKWSATFIVLCWAFGRVDVTRIWQPEHNQISLRWQFHGVPRIPWEVQGVFDGISIFKLDRCVCMWQGSRFGSTSSDPCYLVPLYFALVQINHMRPRGLYPKFWEGSGG